MLYHDHFFDIFQLNFWCNDSTVNKIFRKSQFLHFLKIYLLGKSEKKRRANLKKAFAFARACFRLLTSLMSIQTFTVQGLFSFFFFLWKKIIKNKPKQSLLRTREKLHTEELCKLNIALTNFLALEKTRKQKKKKNKQKKISLNYNPIKIRDNWWCILLNSMCWQVSAWLTRGFLSQDWVSIQKKKKNPNFPNIILKYSSRKPYFLSRAYRELR